MFRTKILSTKETYRWLRSLEHQLIRSTCRIPLTSRLSGRGQELFGIALRKWTSLLFSLNCTRERAHRHTGEHDCKLGKVGSRLSRKLELDRRKQLSGEHVERTEWTNFSDVSLLSRPKLCQFGWSEGGQRKTGHPLNRVKVRWVYWSASKASEPFERSNRNFQIGTSNLNSN